MDSCFLLPRMKKYHLSVLLCVCSLIQLVALREIGRSCTNHQVQRKCVDIDLCLNLRKIYNKSIHFDADIEQVQNYACGERMVCCELPFIMKPLPVPPVCGNPGMNYRIVEGYVTEINQFPWTVILKSNNGDILCGGSLISTRYIVTAAHCVWGKNSSEIEVVLGEWDTDTDPDCDEDLNCNPIAVRQKVVRIVIHQNYRTRHNDIALLRIENALSKDYTPHIAPICLPINANLQQDQLINTNVSIVGWGDTEFLGDSSSKKLYANVRTVSNEECLEELSPQIKGIEINGRHMCAKPFEGYRHDTCTRDSGGPLQLLRGGSYYLIGVVSYGLMCGTELPAVYTRVNAYMSWILENMSND